MILRIFSDPHRARIAAVSLFLSATSVLPPLYAQVSATPSLKKPGASRIGILLPQNALSGASNQQEGQAMQQAESVALTGPTLESVPLQASSPDQAMAEAKQLNCDYVLGAALTQQKVESGGRFGKMMNMRAIQTLGSSAVFLPGSSNVKQIGAMAGQVAQQQLSTASQGVKANSDVTLHYTLTAVDGRVALDDSAKVRSKSNGENVLTPLLTEAATKIAAVAKPISLSAGASASGSTPTGTTGTAPSETAALRTYGNYDFVSGDKPTFVDDFTTTQDGEFPQKWELIKGQGAVNQQAGRTAFVLNSGDPARMNIRMRQANYLGNQFTLEFDIFGVDSAYGTSVYFNSNAKEEVPSLVLRTNRAFVTSRDGEMEGIYPNEISIQNFIGKWHHVAVAYKAPQVKVYVDQYRVLYLPDMKALPQSIAFGGEAGPNNPIAIANVRLATGGGANYVGKQFTEAKIVTHSINFDLDKATLRPESMGALNQIAKLLNSDTSLKFEIDGHTDNSGNASHNLELSDQRAAAVKAQLIQMGIDASRLTTKGLGDTKPLGPNDTPEGQANNRRVEFIRLDKAS